MGRLEKGKEMRIVQWARQSERVARTVVKACRRLRGMPYVGTQLGAFADAVEARLGLVRRRERGIET